MKKFLITGIGGFVGSYFWEYLEKQPEKSIVLGLDMGPESPISAANFSYQQMDLTDRLSVYKTIEDFQPDYILHLASFSSVSQSWKMPAESFINNTNIFLNIVEAIRSLALKTRILSIGSSEEYGDYPIHTMPLREEYELYPGSPYAVARVSQEMLSKLYAERYHLNIIMTRSFNHIGPRQRDVFVIPSFIKQLVKIANCDGHGELYVGNIEVVRDFLDVRDVVDAYYRILIQGKIGSTYNVCSGIGVKLKDIIQEAMDILHIQTKIIVDPQRIRPTENMCIIGDNTRLINELNWHPNHTMKGTITEMIDYWKSYLTFRDFSNCD